MMYNPNIRGVTRRRLASLFGKYRPYESYGRLFFGILANGNNFLSNENYTREIL